MRVISTAAGSNGRSPAPILALWLLSRGRQAMNPRRSPSTEHGLTLIECLVAIVIISLTVVAITPPIMLATASRIQSRKAEKANQVAQGEIDRVRLLVERGTYGINDLPGTTGTINSTGTSNNISTFAAGTNPTGGSLSSPASCNTYPPATPVGAAALIQVDVDGDCTPEYVMQVFRTPGYAPTVPTPTVPFSFEMGVRVYSYYPGQAFPNLDTTKASLRMSTGPLDQVGGRRRPLAVLYSKMARNDSSRSLGQMCVQNGGPPANCNY